MKKPQRALAAETTGKKSRPYGLHFPTCRARLEIEAKTAKDLEALNRKKHLAIHSTRDLKRFSEEPQGTET